MIPILCLPASTGSDLTPATMNWTVLVWGAPMSFALIWWFVDAHKWFKGPKVNIEHMMGPNVIEGQDGGSTSEHDSTEEVKVFHEGGKIA